MDYTAPLNSTTINDSLGNDIDTTHLSNQLSANWIKSVDQNSNIIEYWVSIGTSAGDSDIVNWTNNILDTFAIKTSLSLINGQKYFFNIRSINSAGLASTITSSDGVVYEDLINKIISYENSDEVMVYPNPSKGTFTINSKIPIKDIQITDLLGKRIMYSSFENEVIIKIDNLKPGSYILSITNKENKKVFLKIMNLK